MKDISSIEAIMNVLSKEAKKALQVLCVPNLLEDSLAESLLQDMDVANGNTPEIIKRLRDFPIWRYRTIRTWVFNDDIREYCIGKLNGSGKKIRKTVLRTLRAKRKEFEDFAAFNINDYDLQVARLALTIEEEKPEAIKDVRAIFELATHFNELETGRVIDLYLEEDIPEAEQTGKSLPPYMLNAFFMRGMYAYKKKNHNKALKFMLPVWEKRHNDDASIHDAAIAAHIVGLIWSKSRETWKDAEDAYKSSLELGKGDRHHQAQVYNDYAYLLSKDSNRWDEAENAYNKSLELGKGNVLHKVNICTSFGKFLLRDKKDYSSARKHLEFALEHERDAKYRKQLLSLLEELDRAEDPENPKGVDGKNLLKFAGTIDPNDLELMSKAIDEGCEQVDIDE
ncbi:MAG: hypothetical protein HQL05_04615 [Nitrospirae bacterium]|nr:hypothetical protein [Nitrospirota bacterium]